MGSSTGRTRAPSISRHPGQSALSPARNGHFLEPTWPSRSPAACTPRWRRWCPMNRHTRCPTSPGTGPPPGPDTGHLRSPASEPNSIRSRTLQCGTGRPPRCVSGATTSEAFSRTGYVLLAKDPGQQGTLGPAQGLTLIRRKEQTHGIVLRSTDAAMSGGTPLPQHMRTGLPPPLHNQR